MLRYMFMLGSVVTDHFYIRLSSVSLKSACLFEQFTAKNKNTVAGVSVTKMRIN